MPTPIVALPVNARPVPSLPGYYADDTGQVYREKNGQFLVLKQSKAVRGYMVIGVRAGDVRAVRPVHHLVLEAFCGPRPPKMFGCHNDGDRTNNRLENLRYDTAQANQLDRDRHGTSNCGTRNGQSKLSEADVAEVRRMLDAGCRNGEISRRFNVSPATISDIKAGRTWGKINTAA